MRFIIERQRDGRFNLYVNGKFSGQYDSWSDAAAAGGESAAMAGS